MRLWWRKAAGPRMAARDRRRAVAAVAAGLVVGLVGSVGTFFSMTTCVISIDDMPPETRQMIYFQFLGAELERYAADHGDVAPSSLAQLGPSEDRDRLAERGALERDVWGSPISYRAEGLVYELRSPGPDRLPGTDDDIVQTDALTYNGKRALAGHDTTAAVDGVVRGAP